jgi:hypothetical protein
MIADDRTGRKGCEQTAKQKSEILLAAPELIRSSQTIGNANRYLMT